MARNHIDRKRQNRVYTTVISHACMYTCKYACINSDLYRRIASYNGMYGTYGMAYMAYGMAYMAHGMI
jgi:hypothetical protein